MLIKDLPKEQREQFRALVESAGEPWNVIENLDVVEADDWFQARADDLHARVERRRRRLAVVQELNDIARSVCERYPDLPMCKVEYFLHGEVRARFQTLWRELEEMSQVPLVTRDRQSWHRAVEEEIRRQHICTVDDIVDAVLVRDPAYPSAPVRQYAEYILETSAGMR